MEVPESVVIGLRNVRPTFNLRWNPKARNIGERSFDVMGNPREITWDGRWELWDTDNMGIDYPVMTLEDKHGDFMPPGDWLVETVNMINPARYGGDVSKMIEELVDKPNLELERLGEKSWEDLVDSLAKYYTLRRPLVAVP